MGVFKKEEALKVFYYLMSVDGEISSEELTFFDEVGQELLGEEYQGKKQSLIDDCNNQIHSNIDDSDVAYDLISEGVDKALSKTIGDPSQGVSPRLLIWNLLVMALSNDEYSKTERRLIKHIVRTHSIDSSVFLEMEQMIQTLNAVSSELRWLEDSNRPYAEIRPLVEENEKRQTVIRESARALIEDEVIPLEEENEDHLKVYWQEQKAKIEDRVNPVASEVAAQTEKLVGNVKEQSKNLFGNAKKLFAKKEKEE